MTVQLSWIHAPAADIMKSYDFLGARGQVSWPQQNGQNLAGAGLWNLLWRLGVHPPPPGLRDKGHVLLALDGPLPNETLHALRSRIENGPDTVIAAGDPSALSALLPQGVTIVSQTPPNPSAALAYQGLVGTRPQIVAPPLWDFFKIAQGHPSLECHGSLVGIAGDRESPERALVMDLNAPAAVQCGRLVLLNGNPFAALQAWLQGQEDLTPWLAWRHAMFWLDEQVEFLADTLGAVGLSLSDAVAPGVSGLGETTVIMRHDVDSSRDTSLLEASLKAGTGASHAILQDADTQFWINALADKPRQEVAFHYNTLRGDTPLERVKRVFGWRPPTEYRPAQRTLAGKGLQRQIQVAREHGIDAKTLHRHASFIVYPELIDALDYVFSHKNDVLGGSSFFRGQVLRWGIDRTDGARGTVGSFPYPMFPFWLPFRLAHAGDGGRLSRGFETTSVMESEPELVAQMLNYRSRWPMQRVLTLSYHPFHAQRASFNLDGTIHWFQEIQAILLDRGIEILPLVEVANACHASIDQTEANRLA